MLLWFFDSWLGGEVVMEAFQRKYPDIRMILEMDPKNAPYWHRNWDDIRELTKIWVEKLHARWVDVIILACNTASVHALRWLQTEIFPGRHILGVTVPWAEAIVERWYRKIWVLATDATVRSKMYKERVHMLDSMVIVEEVWAPGLVPLIEEGITSWSGIDMLLRGYLSEFSPDIEALVLGCTHYPLIVESIERVWIELYNKKTPDLIDPGEEAARKFRGWMERKNF